MLKKILKLDGAQLLSKKRQKNISGGRGPRPGGGGGCCDPSISCCTTTDLVNNPECGATLYSRLLFPSGKS